MTYARRILFSLLGLCGLLSCNQAQKTTNAGAAPTSRHAEVPALGPFIGLAGDTLGKVEKTPAQWRAQLSEKAYHVLREAGTERAFTSDYYHKKDKGVYVCAGCELPLFHSDAKYDSRTGWPSFWKPLRAEHIAEEIDRSYGMTRVEVHCARCGGHQGHLFDDGPPPTGLRYCINSVSLKFVPEEEAAKLKR